MVSYTKLDVEIGQLSAFYLVQRHEQKNDSLENSLSHLSIFKVNATVYLHCLDKYEL